MREVLKLISLYRGISVCWERDWKLRNPFFIKLIHFVDTYPFNTNYLNSICNLHQRETIFLIQQNYISVLHNYISCKKYVCLPKGYFSIINSTIFVKNFIIYLGKLIKSIIYIGGIQKNRMIVLGSYRILAVHWDIFSGKLISIGSTYSTTIPAINR
jgi:hypothetical protein